MSAFNPNVPPLPPSGAKPFIANLQDIQNKRAEMAQKATQAQKDKTTQEAQHDIANVSTPPSLVPGRSRKPPPIPPDKVAAISPPLAAISEPSSVVVIHTLPAAASSKPPTVTSKPPIKKIPPPRPDVQPPLFQPPHSPPFRPPQSLLPQTSPSLPTSQPLPRTPLSPRLSKTPPQENPPLPSSTSAPPLSSFTPHPPAITRKTEQALKQIQSRKTITLSSKQLKKAIGDLANLPTPFPSYQFPHYYPFNEIINESTVLNKATALKNIKDQANIDSWTQKDIDSWTSFYAILCLIDADPEIGKFHTKSLLANDPEFLKAFTQGYAAFSKIPSEKTKEILKTFESISTKLQRTPEQAESVRINQEYLEICTGKQTASDQADPGVNLVEITLPNKKTLQIHEQTNKDINRNPVIIQGHAFPTIKKQKNEQLKLKLDLERRDKIVNELCGLNLPNERIGEILALLCSQTMLAPLQKIGFKNPGMGISSQEEETEREHSIKIENDEVVFTASGKFNVIDSTDPDKPPRKTESFTTGVKIRIPIKAIREKPMSELLPEECKIKYEIKYHPL